MLEIINQPKIDIIRRLAANVGAGQGKSAVFCVFCPVRHIHTASQLQVLRDVPGGIGLQDSRRIFDVVDGGKKYLEQGVQFYLDVAA